MVSADHRYVETVNFFMWQLSLGLIFNLMHDLKYPNICEG